jgi:hypothetical protein
MIVGAVSRSRFFGAVDRSRRFQYRHLNAECRSWLANDRALILRPSPSRWFRSQHRFPCFCSRFPPVRSPMSPIEHAARPVGCWAPTQGKLAIEQTSGRERINIHGAINLETRQTRMIEVQTVDAASTITLLEAIEALYPLMMLIHVFLDNARYHHAKLVQQWLARPPHQAAFHSELVRSSGYGA